MVSRRFEVAHTHNKVCLEVCSLLLWATAVQCAHNSRAGHTGSALKMTTQLHSGKTRKGCTLYTCSTVYLSPFYQKLNCAFTCGISGYESSKFM